MSKPPSLAIVLVSLGLVGSVACKKKGDEPAAARSSAKDAAPTPTHDATTTAAQPAPAPSVVEDRPAEYELLATQILADLSKKDFASFVKNSMASREQLKEMMEAAWKACPQMAPNEEQRPAAEQMLADYDPDGEAVKGGFEACLAKYDFQNASYLSAKSREHLSMCGSESADHIEVQVTLADAQVTIVLDDLLKSADGWRLVDGGISCSE